MTTIIQQIAALTTEQRKTFVEGLSEAELYDLMHNWEYWARPEQLTPPGDWNAWVILAGRGFGKTRTAAEDMKAYGLAFKNSRIAVVAPTFADARDTCIEGESGLLNILPKDKIAAWNRSMGELYLTNGTKYKLFSADEPERLRGPQHHRAWFDEPCLIAGTLIETEHGPVPIEQIKKGDCVWTRQGLRHVKASWCSNKSAKVYALKTVGGKTLVGTGNHPVWVEGTGFTPLQNVRYGSILTTWNKKLNRASYGEVSGGGLMGDIIATEEAHCCIEPSTAKHTGLSQTECTSTIRMAIKRITISLIWRLLRRQSISRDIPLVVGTRWGKSITAKRHYSYGRIVNPILQPVSIAVGNLLQLVRQQSFATSIAEWRIDAKTLIRSSKTLVSIAENCFFNTNQNYVTALSHVVQRQTTYKGNIKEKYENALCAVKCWLPLTPQPCVVPVPAELYTRIETRNKKQHPAYIAKRNLCRIPHLAACFVLSHAVTTIAIEDRRQVKGDVVQEVTLLSQKMAVFNIEVEDCHEYFANNILTHNCASRYPSETYDQLLFGLRLRGPQGQRPQVVLTTTPKPLKWLKDLIKRKDVHVTTGSTFDNAANLAPAALEQLKARYLGSNLGRQELYAELLDDIEGALWNRAMLERNRVYKAPELVRVVVGVDPAVTNNEDSDETGIVVGGLGEDGHAYVLADYTLKGSPLEWATEVVTAYHLFHADRVVAEVNNGGDLVEQNVKLVDADISYKAVHASRGKVTRAEPVVAIYEQERAHHVGTLGKLEDEQCTWQQGMKSPNRLDALVWVITELGLNSGTIPIIVSTGGAPSALPKFHTSDNEDENARLQAEQERRANIVGILQRLGGL